MTLDEWYRDPAARPRYLHRLFRADDDEPAEGMGYSQKEKLFVCNDGKMRSTCSTCGRSVHTLASTRHIAQEEQNRDDEISAYRRISPRRVLRELLVSEVSESLNPQTQEALLAAIDQSSTSNCSQPPDSPALGGNFDTFPSFSALPFELRHVIWEMALSGRVLQSADVVGPLRRETASTQTARQSPYQTYRNDLFHVCTESRRVVDEYENRGRRIGMTSEARLRASLDVLYCPWMGRKSRNWCGDFR